MCNYLKYILDFFLRKLLLVYLMVIGVELGKKDHSSIAATTIGRGLKLLDLMSELTSAIVIIKCFSKNRRSHLKK
jgi:hypothetical protein